MVPPMASTALRTRLMVSASGAAAGALVAAGTGVVPGLGVAGGRLVGVASISISPAGSLISTLSNVVSMPPLLAVPAAKAMGPRLNWLSFTVATCTSLI